MKSVYMGPQNTHILIFVANVLFLYVFKEQNLPYIAGTYQIVWLSYDQNQSAVLSPRILSVSVSHTHSSSPLGHHCDILPIVNLSQNKFEVLSKLKFRTLDLRVSLGSLNQVVSVEMEQ